MKKMRFKLNVPLQGMPIGAFISLQVDRNGTPIDKYWRNRFLDASYDGCIEAICMEKPKKIKKVKESKEPKVLD